MRIRDIQESLKKLLHHGFYTIDQNNEDLDLILTAKVLAADLLKEENPGQVLLEAFIQLVLVASLLNLDLEKELEKIIVNYADGLAQSS